MEEIYNIIEKIRQRPGMYLGANGITHLHSFLDGYSFALWEYGINDDEAVTLFPLPFSFFYDYVVRYFGYPETANGWCDMILEQSNHDEEQSLSVFFKLLILSIIWR